MGVGTTRRDGRACQRVCQRGIGEHMRSVGERRSGTGNCHPPVPMLHFRVSTDGRVRVVVGSRRPELLISRLIAECFGGSIEPPLWSAGVFLKQIVCRARFKEIGLRAKPRNSNL